MSTYWNSLPVMWNAVDTDAEIHHRVALSEEPVALPRGFRWHVWNRPTSSDLDTIHAFLAKHYRGSDSTVRLLYPRDVLDRFMDLAIAVLWKDQIVGMIGGTEASVRADKDIFRSINVSFLCVSQRMRGKRLTPLLVREMYRHQKDRDMFLFSVEHAPIHPFIRSYSGYFDIDPDKMMRGFRTPKSPRLYRKLYAGLLQRPSRFRCFTADESHLGQMYRLYSSNQRSLEIHYGDADQFWERFRPSRSVVTQVVLDSSDNVCGVFLYYILQYSAFNAEFDLTPNSRTPNNEGASLANVACLLDYFTDETLCATTEPVDIVLDSFRGLRTKEIHSVNIPFYMLRADVRDKLCIRRGKPYARYSFRLALRSRINGDASIEFP